LQRIKHQESYQKNVERAFGVLQAQFAIVRYPALSWSHDQMREVMQACVIMHNIIIENDRKTQVRHIGSYEFQGPLAEVEHQVPEDFSHFLTMHVEFVIPLFTSNCNVISFEHLWRLKGEASTVPTP
jgi:hypothetical protein